MAFIFASSCFLLEGHAFQCRAAARLSPSASQGALCCHSQGAHTGRRGEGVGYGGGGVHGGTNSELSEPPGSLGGVRHFPTFPTCVLPPFLGLPLLCSPPCPSPFLALSLTKLDLRPTGPDPRTGLSQLAYQELPQRSPDRVIEGEQKKTRPLKDRAVPFLGGFLLSV